MNRLMGKDQRRKCGWVEPDILIWPNHFCDRVAVQQDLSAPALPVKRRRSDRAGTHRRRPAHDLVDGRRSHRGPEPNCRTLPGSPLGAPTDRRHIYRRGCRNARRRRKARDRNGRLTLISVAVVVTGSASVAVSSIPPVASAASSSATVTSASDDAETEEALVSDGVTTFALRPPWPPVSSRGGVRWCLIADLVQRPPARCEARRSRCSASRTDPTSAALRRPRTLRPEFRSFPSRLVRTRRSRFRHPRRPRRPRRFPPGPLLNHLPPPLPALRELDRRRGGERCPAAPRARRAPIPARRPGSKLARAHLRPRLGYLSVA